MKTFPVPFLRELEYFYWGLYHKIQNVSSKPRDNTKHLLRFRKQRQSEALLHIVCVYKRNLFIVLYVLYSFMSLKKIKRATVIKMLIFGKKYFLSMDSTNILTKDTYCTDNHKYEPHL